MVDSQYSTNDYKLFKISIGAVIKNTEMLSFFPDCLKTKKMCKNASEELPFLIRCVPDLHKTQKMCDEVIVENG